MVDDQGAIDLVLIHGTHAKNAPWTDPGSDLASFLCDGLPVHSIHRFSWSGTNSFRARRQATHDLVASLDEDRSGASTRPLVVIAHSHGGNVCRDALVYDTVRRRVAGFVCLSTPFFTAREREFHVLGRHSLGVMWWIMATVGFVAAFWVGCLALIRTFDRYEGPLDLFDSSGFWPIVGAAFVAWLATWFWLRSKAKQGKEAAAAVLKWQREADIPPPCPVLVVTNARDEATGALVGIRFGAWIVGAPTRWLRAKVSRRAFVFLALCLVQLGLIKILPVIGGWIGAYSIAWAYIFIPAALFFGLTGIATLYLVAGWDAPAMAPFIEVNAESLYAGRAETFRAPDPGGLGLAHSTVYGDPHVWQEMVDWIRLRVLASDPR